MLEHGLAPTTGAYEIEQSLRFNNDDSAYLSWTPTSTGNRKTFTWSGWVKIGNLLSNRVLFSGASNVAGNIDGVRLDSDDTLNFWLNDGASGRLTTNALFRDPSAWYHIVLAMDTTQATASNRLKMYVNGEQITSFATATYPSQNFEGGINNTVFHAIGVHPTTSNGQYLDGYLAEVHFIDGQALDPSNFGETGDYGEWKPIEYDGTYGGNGFYLKMNKGVTTEGMNVISYGGTGTTTHYETDLAPDLVWIKGYSGSFFHYVFDSVRGAGKRLTITANAEVGPYPAEHTSFDATGFTVGGDAGTNGSGNQYVAYCFDAGNGSPVTNTDGDITATVKANPDKGFSIVTWTSTTTAAHTVGHGLNQKPDIVINKNRNGTSNWLALYDVVDSSFDYMSPSTNAAALAASGYTADATTFTSWYSSVYDMVAYCFHSVAGYSKIGSYTGTGAGGNTITTGFKPAFVMVKRTDSTSDWYMLDNVRNSHEADQHKVLYMNGSWAENASDGTHELDLHSSDTGFTPLDNTYNNASGATYLYMAFADTSEYEFWKDYSGNNNNWRPNNLTETDVVTDSPTNNFCTLNAIDGAGSGTLSEGNLKFPSTDYAVRRGTFQIPKTGKWYWEWVAIGGTYGSYGAITSNVTDSAGNNIYGTGQGDDTSMFSSQYYDNYTDTAPVTSHGSYTSGDICQVAFDADIGTAYYYKNGTLTHTDTTLPTNVDLFPLAFNTCCSFSTGVWNFGQDSSFAGNKTAQGNTDDNGYGDFYYAPPTGYLALCTQNLPDATVIPSEHFNTVIYSGNGYPNTGVTNVITGVGFQPDMTWLKERATTAYHHLFDVLRGSNKALFSNGTNAEYTNVDAFNSFDADGFTLGQDTNGDGVNRDATTYNTTVVAWNWKANGAGVSNTDGTITSTVSANTSAGFSIVNFVGTGSNGTVGHGLTQTPELIINKPRDRADNWNVYCEYNGTADPETDYLILNSTSAPLDNNTIWNDTAPTSSVFNVGTNGGVNASGENFINYCFHSVDGYSKVGSYTGNGSTDGTFVYTGFRPAYVMIKRTDSTSNWTVMDDDRELYNGSYAHLWADVSDAESSGTSTFKDFTSNGFKIRTTNTGFNASGGTYIYIAFAKNPFKHSNAR